MIILPGRMIWDMFRGMCFFSVCLNILCFMLLFILFLKKGEMFYRIIIVHKFFWGPCTPFPARPGRPGGAGQAFQGPQGHEGPDTKNV